ncbi:MAG: glutathione-disulfide reductase, partial [Candidatus Caenarcaniphilales bacterium]|nr:glutathione-disulfide reductase [Candidatus Caenarcaniphilales bacterium]
MSKFEYDLFVIGAGSGGVRASRMSASYGAKVAIAENKYLGGTCVNVGCVPKKLLFYASHFREDFENSHGYGWSLGSQEFNWQTLIKNKDTEIQRLNGIYRKILGNAGVDIMEGSASVIDEHTVEINGKKISAKYILLATGGWPIIPDIPGKEYAITSNELFHLENLPKEIVIVGGGYIAVEFAGIMQGLGSKVTLIYRGPLFLRGFDHDIRCFLAEEMKKKGIDLRFMEQISSIVKSGNKFICELAYGGKLNTDAVLYCIGREPNIQGLGLENVSVEIAKSYAIKVDDYFKTSVDSIYAIGDVIDRVKLTPVALAEAMALSKNLFKSEKIKVNYSNIATAVFSQPNIGTVGLTEEQAKEQFDDIAIYLNDTRALKHTLSGSPERALLKIIVDKKTDKVLGFHMVGPDAGEIMQGLGVAMQCGVTKKQLDSTIGIHPTMAEEFVTMREATREFN